MHVMHSKGSVLVALVEAEHGHDVTAPRRRTERSCGGLPQISNPEP